MSARKGVSVFVKLVFGLEKFRQNFRKFALFRSAMNFFNLRLKLSTSPELSERSSLALTQSCQGKARLRDKCSRLKFNRSVEPRAYGVPITIPRDQVCGAVRTRLPPLRQARGFETQEALLCPPCAPHNRRQPRLLASRPPL